MVTRKEAIRRKRLVTIISASAAALLILIPCCIEFERQLSVADVRMRIQITKVFFLT